MMLQIDLKALWARTCYDDLEIYHDGGGSYISNNTGILRLQAKSGENSISLNPDGSVELYYDHEKKLETASTGILLGLTTAIGTDGLQNGRSGNAGNAGGEKGADSVRRGAIVKGEAGAKAGGIF